jgi:hypothetical protein
MQMVALGGCAIINREGCTAKTFAQISPGERIEAMNYNHRQS